MAQETAFAVTKLRTELESTARFIAGNENAFLNTFWRKQMAPKEEELKIKEAALEVLLAKAEKERQAKEDLEKAAADLEAKEQAFNEAQQAREAKKIKAEAAKIAHAASLQEE